MWWSLPHSFQVELPFFVIPPKCPSAQVLSSDLNQWNMLILPTWDPGIGLLSWIFCTKGFNPTQKHLRKSPFHVRSKKHWETDQDTKNSRGSPVSQFVSRSTAMLSTPGSVASVGSVWLRLFNVLLHGGLQIRDLKFRCKSAVPFPVNEKKNMYKRLGICDMSNFCCSDPCPELHARRLWTVHCGGPIGLGEENQSEGIGNGGRAKKAWLPLGVDRGSPWQLITTTNKPGGTTTMNRGQLVKEEICTLLGTSGSNKAQLVEMHHCSILWGNREVKRWPGCSSLGMFIPFRGPREIWPGYVSHKREHPGCLVQWCEVILDVLPGWNCNCIKTSVGNHKCAPKKDSWVADGATFLGVLGRRIYCDPQLLDL